MKKAFEYIGKKQLYYTPWECYIARGLLDMVISGILYTIISFPPPITTETCLHYIHYNIMAEQRKKKYILQNIDLDKQKDER